MQGVKLNLAAPHMFYMQAINSGSQHSSWDEVWLSAHLKIQNSPKCKA
jgi:hypothetical protein